MARFVIRGGRPLGGVHKPPGNKNAALPMLAAALLTDEPVVLHNVPMIEDVRTMLGILEHLRADISISDHTVTVCAKSVRRTRLDEVLCRKARSSVLFAAPLVARHGRATLFPPGGDMIGRRPLDTHFDAMRRLGVEISGHYPFVFRRRSLRGCRLLLDEASVTATENVVMAATLAAGKTVLWNAACEPHVQDLCTMLNKMGARISGIGTNRLEIEGVEALHGVEHRVGPDYVDVASFMAASVVTGGELTVPDVDLHDMAVIARAFRRLGVSWKKSGTGLILPAARRLRVRNAYDTTIPKLEDGPWPGFPSDLMSISIVMATQAKGTMLFFEKMFESRMYFVDRLIDMGARIVQCDPHRVIVTGPSRLHGARHTSPDIRAGMALLIAALCARGESTIDNAQCIDRGYEDVERELSRLGADITREA